jgi:hypothetical protein
LPAFLRRTRTVADMPLAQPAEAKPRGLRAALEGSEVVANVHTQPVSTPVAAPVNPEPVRVAPITSAPTPAAHGQTIDLKRMRSSNPSVPATNTSHGHVINLKR